MVCHRRAGKTVACINDLLRSALTTDRQDWRGAYIAPYYGQAKDVAWAYLKRFAGVVPGVQFSEVELRADFPNGSRIRLYGADNADVRLRGIYLDDVVLDEYADFAPGLWGEVIRPLLADRKGRAVFIGTPKGHNGFYSVWAEADGKPDWFRLMLRASDTGIIDADELTAAAAQMTGDQYAQEFECSFDAAIQGAYYAKDIAAADKDGRITDVPVDRALPVHTAWDLGIADSMPIIFFQVLRGGSVRFVDCYEASGHGLDHYARVLTERGYTYGDHWAPHDIEVRELGSGRSRMETAASLGLRFKVAPNLPVQDGINAVRMMLPRAWFDKRKTAPMLEALRQYREKHDEKRQVSLGPLHDWTSHFADAMRYAAVAMKEQSEKRRRSDTQLNWMG
jgi:phage terminase large subunit